MRKLILASAARSLLARPAVILPARFKGRANTCDGVAFNLRMPAGSPGDMTRHNPPGTIEPCLLDPASTAVQPGQAVLASQNASNGVRALVAGDAGGASIYGVVQRVYPFQQPTTTTNYGGVGFGAVAVPSNQPVDIVRSGYMLVPIVGIPQKGNPVYVWAAATAAGHTQGGFETQASGGNTIALDSKSTFSGGVDSNGNGELCFNI